MCSNDVTVKVSYDWIAVRRQKLFSKCVQLCLTVSHCVSLRLLRLLRRSLCIVNHVSLPTPDFDPGFGPMTGISPLKSHDAQHGAWQPRRSPRTHPSPRRSSTAKLYAVSQNVTAAVVKKQRRDALLAEPRACFISRCSSVRYLWLISGLALGPPVDTCAPLSRSLCDNEEEGSMLP